MKLARREVLKGGTAVLALASAPRLTRARETDGPAVFQPKPGVWRDYEITTTIDIQGAEGLTQAWVPIPAFEGEGWARPGSSLVQHLSGKAEIVADPSSGAKMMHIVWPDGEKAPSAAVVSRFSGRDRSVDVASIGSGPTLGADARKHYTAATELIPTDGIVKETAEKIVAGKSGELEKARAIYDWVVDNTFRDPKTRGCGLGDVASMLTMGNLKGKCADLNALYVGLARASGLPARDVYGIRVGPSAFGYKSLGAKSEVITKAQHCRAEVFVEGIGWIPVDPADVRKVVLEEPPGNLPLDDQKVLAARAALFGAWETNWLAYNDAHDVRLPGSSGPPLAYLMYPQAETGGRQLDCLDPDAFKYRITVRQV